MRATGTRAIASLFLAIATVPGIAQAQQWDVDADQALSEAEFAEGFAERGIFSEWDRDDDGALSAIEFTDGVFGTYDGEVVGDNYGVEAMSGKDDDRASQFWGPGQRDFEDWDIDGDSVILSNEFLDGWGDLNTFHRLDADGDEKLSEQEFTLGIFEKYDEDTSGLIEDPELTAIGDDMGAGGLWDM